MLGGGVVQAGDLLIESARATFAELVEGGDRRPGIRDRGRRLRGAGRCGRRRPGGARGRLGLMRTGVVLPTFRDTPDEAFAAATEAVGGRGGRRVLLRPHLAPGPTRAAGAGALPHPRCVGDDARPVPRPRGGARTSAPSWPGSGWSPTRCSPRSSSALEALAPGRVIAGLGTGRQAERGGEPRLRHPLPAGGGAPGGDGRAGAPAGPGGAHGVGGRGSGRADGGGPGRRGGADRVGRRAGARGRADGRARRRGGDLGRAAALGLAAVGRAAAARCTRRAPPGPSSAGRSTSRSWPRRRTSSAEAPGPGARDPGRRLPRWSSAASTGCRPTCSPPSTTSRQRRGGADATSSTSASGTPTCPRPTWR